MYLKRGHLLTHLSQLLISALIDNVKLKFLLEIDFKSLCFFNEGLLF